jgi:tyrosyl-tRNA synthetase
MKSALDILRERGFVAQVTFEDELEKLFQSGEMITYYTGFDPTADSLHIGHYIPIMAMSHLQKAGHRPIALMGAGTAMVGDPSGKTDMRRMLTVEDIDQNALAVKAQMSRFLDFTSDIPNRAIMANNADWLRELKYVDFLRDVGSLFSVNRMLTAECYKQRLEKGLTFLEFNYMLMQSYDFLELFHRYNCALQTGGDDQWSNILSGADLIRRKEAKPAFALTFKLLLTHDGRKMGKTEKGALWLDKNRTSPYDFYQYFRNVDDQDVEKCLALLTFLPMEEVKRLAALEGSGINEAKRTLAFEVTKLIHGTDEAQKARDAAEALFGGGGDIGNIPTTHIPKAQFDEDSRLVALCALTGLTKSKGEARKAIEGGGLYVGNDKVTDVDARATLEQLQAGLILRRGKKSYHRVLLAP